MSKVMVTVTVEGSAPSLQAVRERYHLSENEIDESFGVVEVDPQEHVYAVLVDSDAAARMVPDADWRVQGPFSNPRIEPFGPPEG